MRGISSQRLAAVAALALAAFARNALAKIQFPEDSDSTAPASAVNPATYPLCSAIEDDLGYIDIYVGDTPAQCDQPDIASEWLSAAALPSTAERKALCTPKCAPLIEMLLSFTMPLCSVKKAGKLLTYRTIVEYAFYYCNTDATLDTSVSSASASASASMSASASSSGSSKDEATPSSSTNASSAASGAASTPGASSPTSTTTTSPSSPEAAPSTTSSPSSDAATGTSTSSGGSNAALIAGIIGGVVVILALIAAFVVRSRSKSSNRNEPTAARASNAVKLLDADQQRRVEDNPARASAAFSPLASTTRSSATRRYTGSSMAPSNQSRDPQSGSRSSGKPRSSATNVWEDPAIVAVRIAIDTVTFGELLSRGGYGVVYRGIYKGEAVAIKQLLPERRKDLHQVDQFLSEVKLMAALDHERIVRFIGVAWNSLSDVCVVVEYMDNGDLRSALTRFEADGDRPHGFDADKVKIALHVAHALTYLHSLQPVVVHRDLKSRNILLDQAFDAKLTDFGVSRERADHTMTAGVGSSLWMAPEVMLGERYDEKADIFSFGVVLSELDSHLTPYSSALVQDADAGGVGGRRLPETAILQLVSLGRLRVAFSAGADAALVALGNECVSLKPEDRPSAAEVLHRVHQVWRTYNYRL